ncbi:hypothetical protein NQ314_020156 [Rhamnusium bicolor]|uniref:Uncharacterized protein n=1 Tax=Rhamnusium bicolor TaxID=1586634 RepID=A0AAV8WMC0_9CUCU|nr:hypothetical protein NQ314_020156 [Rhamnusium bicolor]
MFIGNLVLSGNVMVIVENPELPYVAIGYDNGILELISIYKPEKPTVMTSFNLTKNRIGNVKFFEKGHVIVVGSSDIGEFFLIEVNYFFNWTLEHE